MYYEIVCTKLASFEKDLKHDSFRLSFTCVGCGIEIWRLISNLFSTVILLFFGHRIKEIADFCEVGYSHCINNITKSD